jgi:hypothetical protein
MNIRARVSTKLRGELVFDHMHCGLKAGQYFNITEEEMKIGQIRVALSGKLITIEKEETDTKKSQKENKTKIVAKKGKVEVETEDIAEEKDIVVRIQPTNMVSYDLETGKILNKAKSQKVALERSNIEEQEPMVKVGKIDLGEESKEVAPKTKTKAKTKNGSKAANALKKAVSDLEKISKKTIKPVGNKREANSDARGDEFLIGQSIPDISFVDEEQVRSNMDRRIKNESDNEM